ncbi:MAG TPA: prephenate dehydrogenase [Planctomycetes bacterium]|nr:prephenate dehydrogenase [Planctomycetota bacterium]
MGWFRVFACSWWGSGGAVDSLDCVAIVGVGLIGGSVGLALRQRGLAETVVGIGRRQSTLRAARRVGAVTRTTQDLAAGVARADLVLVCVPIGSIVEQVRRVAEHARPGTLITDAGSTKAEIVRALDRPLARGCRFVGSHPLAGSEKAGPQHARADLFQGRLVVLTPTRRSRPGDVERLERFWSALGAEVVRMTAAEHDRAVAWTSHLPHAAAVALAAVVPGRYLPLAGTGLEDTSRLAGGSPELWTQIFAANRRHVAAALRRFERQIQALRAAVEQENSSRLKRILSRAKTKRDAVGS